jgi:antitoxin (DNA-binding transcriptional repressor) of toxin-antitoxin stability system
MARTQIRLTEKQMSKVRQAARVHGVSIAEMIRRLVDRGIAAELPDRSSAYGAASVYVGAFRDRADATDVGERHDAYLASEGEEIVISKSGKPKAELVPLEDLRPERTPEKGRGAWTVRDDFDAPLPEDIRAAFEGSDD